MSNSPSLAPGVHRRVPELLYHRLDYASSSRLGTLFEQTPAHTRLHTPPTKPMKIGSLVHAMLLQPERPLHDQFTIEPDDLNRRTNEGKAWVADAERLELTEHRTVVDARMIEIANRMKDSALGQSVIRDLLDASDERELTIIWHAPNGVKCKSRLDALSPASSILVDIKTSRDASLAEFSKSLAYFGYHRQLGFYTKHAIPASEIALATPNIQVMVIVIENEPPYGAAIYHVDPLAIEQGAAEMNDALAVWYLCEKRDLWPAYPDQIQPITLPFYAARHSAVPLYAPGSDVPFPTGRQGDQS